MSENMNINVHHVTRVEGHGNIVINVQKGKIEKCEWQVPEAPRFFEAMVRGRHYTEVARITSRICGICSVGHTLASVKATENALGIKNTEQTIKLRRLLKHAENFDSHAVHVFVLVAPDLFGAPSIFPLIPTHGDIIKLVLKTKRLGHEWGSLLAGRTTHPTTVVPGGFTKLPTEKELKELKQKLLDAAPGLNTAIDVVYSVKNKLPKFERPTEYIALSSESEYGLYDGMIQSVLPDGSKENWPVSDYRKITNEYISPISTAKYTKNKMESYAAGALSRFNNNYERLHPEAKNVAERFGLKPICTNPYLNSVAQLVEMVHDVYDSINLIDDLLNSGIKEEKIILPSKFSSGSGAVEVPRGILFHEYSYDDEGLCTAANCIIPTNQNHGNIQKDFEKLVPELLQARKKEKEIELACEMLVRSYDPCISCSTHYLKVKFV